MDPELLKELKDPAKQLEKLKQFFDLLDKDKKGYLVPAEVKAGIKEKFGGAGIPLIPEDPEKEAEFLKIADPTNSGKITFDGLKAAAKAHRDKVKAMIQDPAKVEAEAKRVFAKLDLKKQGFLEVAALKDIDAKLLSLNLPGPKPTEEQKKQLLKVADPNGTGKITEAQFVTLAKTIVEKMKADGLFQ